MYYSQYLRDRFCNLLKECVCVPFSLSTRANIGELRYTERGALTREGLSSFV